MKITESIPRNRRMPSLRNVVMIDTVRGVLRVRKWPKKRGTPRSALQRWWIDWFRQANILAKYVDGASQALAIAMTKGSGLYPRDVLLKAMRGRLYHFTDQDGNKWFPMAGIQDISDTLDMLAQTVGSVLVRAVDRWRAAGPDVPAIGDALTYQGPTTPPIWTAPGAGVSQQALPGMPIVPNNTVNYYDIDVSSYADITLNLINIGFAGADVPRLRVSTDGGIAFHAAASDYHNFTLTAASFGNSDASLWGIAFANVTTGHDGSFCITGLRAGRAMYGGECGTSAAAGGRRSGFMNLDGPITDIRIFSNAGNNFNAGVIYGTGLLAS